MVTNSQEPVDELAGEISSAQSDVNSLQDDVQLTSLRSDVEDVDNSADGLPQRIADLRSRGYVFDKDLEGRVQDLKARWDQQRGLVLSEISRQNSELVSDLHGIEALMAQVVARASDPVAARPVLAQAKSAISSLGSKADAAQDAVKSMFSAFASDLDTLKSRLDKVDWMLIQLSQACFTLLATEAAVMAVEAVWIKAGKESADDPRGVLYLTDQRLIFEQKQEIATKKFLFVATEKQKVQQLQFEFPLSLVEGIKPSKQGFLSHEDHFELNLASGAPFHNLHLHLLGQDGNAWQGLINQVKSGAVTQARAVAVDQAMVDKVKAAPTQCPVCGGAITQPVLRGIDSLKCEYCGNIIRL